MGLKFEVTEVFAMIWIKVVCCLVTELRCYWDAWGAYDVFNVCDALMG